MTVRKSWRRVDGVLLLDKPAGMSSNSALQAARRLFSAAKAGHTGTLDPMASGLLPLCFGEATKFSVDLLAADKTYEAQLLFGVRTDTGDADGTVVMRSPVSFGRTELEAALTHFRGPIRQIPPMYSALKRDGRPLYELARQGIEVEREARAVTIHELLLLDFSGDRCRLRVACSKGTYIRSLAEDLGAALACGAHLTALRRLVVGPLQIADAVTLDQLAALAEEARGDCLLAPDALLQSLPAVYLDDVAGQRFRHGNSVTIAGLPGKCRVYAENRLLGLGELDDAGHLQPRRVLGAL
ncbi:MAG: tRNA pseudouridine(55) synthase TruB [Candidatus Accumulibacter phosphatis]|jgi:tRNA pseudouridine55 synthase|uniref:tRNA pseudouridine synthase B n=2 Tax=Candidatus Accumulibacter TaxID=327159 RepID=A0A080LVI3_9PROT|nr:MULTISPECIES: tRNA pseudouridine(55) synthase TruB [Candidatus Accumulibacter]KFB72677.1 MAG: tRNA pseudouridine synthase B [Candidatus Accumulibacter phosphatis]MBL8406575.1 tRNA pseudouridine(55) synthase TruB [Accumulibacter sp.]NMQ06446.1 tRNA pseudouridine(55) synthase TruB [Candidatus Accumulibacter contiguus]